MVKMVQASSQAQASSVGSLVDNYTNGFNQTIASVNALAEASELSGQAYNNAKSYASSVVVPLIQAFLLYAEAVQTDTKKLPDNYPKEVDSKDWDSDDLDAKISALNSTIATNQGKLEGLNSKTDLSADEASQKSSLESALSTDRADLSHYQDILQKLNNFNDSSSGFFSDIAELEGSITTGLSQLQSDVSSFGGSFSLPSKQELQWTKTIHDKWKQGVSNNLVIDASTDEFKDYLKHSKKGIKYTKDGLYIVSSGKYYWKHSGKHYWMETKGKKWTDFYKRKDKWDSGNIGEKSFSKKGARIKEVPIVGKYLEKNKKLKKLTSKLKSYEHGRLNHDLKLMKENNLTRTISNRAGKAGKYVRGVGKTLKGGLKVAGWVGTAIDAKDAAKKYKLHGYSNEQTVAMTTRKVAVDAAASSAGSTVGRVAGAAVGQAVIPIPGVGAAIGSVAGSIAGGWLGSKVGDAINKQMDKNVKPKKSGWSWPW